MWDIPLYPSYVNGLSTSTKHNPVICGIYPSYIIWLVVLTILKNMKVNRKDDNPYTKWKITVMFETTNQYIYIYIIMIIFPLKSPISWMVIPTSNAICGISATTWVLLGPNKSTAVPSGEVHVSKEFMASEVSPGPAGDYCYGSSH